MTVSVRSSVVVVAMALGAVGCKGGSPSQPTPPPSPPTPTTTITITTGGVNPKNIEVALGARVRFINNDTRSHNMTSDPHPDHTDCPEINQVGFLLVGQMRETGNLVQARTCGFHDHNDPGNQALLGSIIIK